MLHSLFAEIHACQKDNRGNELHIRGVFVVRVPSPGPQGCQESYLWFNSVLFSSFLFYLFDYIEIYRFQMQQTACVGIRLWPASHQTDWEKTSRSWTRTSLKGIAWHLDLCDLKVLYTVVENLMYKMVCDIIKFFVFWCRLTTVDHLTKTTMKKLTQGMSEHNKAMSAAKTDEEKANVVSTLTCNFFLFFFLVVFGFSANVLHLCYVFFFQKTKKQNTTTGLRTCYWQWQRWTSQHLSLFFPLFLVVLMIWSMK